MDALLELAERQHSLVSQADAARLGVSLEDLRNARRRGVLERLGPNCHRVVGSVRTWEQRLLSAVLLSGEPAAATLSASAYLSGLRGAPQRKLEVVTLRRPSRPAVGWRAHCTNYLPPHHITVVDSIPTTVPARMLLDILGRRPYTLDFDRAKRLVDNALVQHLVTERQITVMVAECGASGRNGVGVLRAILGDIRGDYTPSESELEDLVLKVLAAAGLPAPKRQRWVGGTSAPAGRVDMCYGDVRVNIEADSKKWHEGWGRQEADRERDLILRAQGIECLRVSYGILVNNPRIFTSAVAQARVERGG